MSVKNTHSIYHLQISKYNKLRDVSHISWALLSSAPQLQNWVSMHSLPQPGLSSRSAVCHPGCNFDNRAVKINLGQWVEVKPELFPDMLLSVQIQVYRTGRGASSRQQGNPLNLSEMLRNAWMGTSARFQKRKRGPYQMGWIHRFPTSTKTKKETQKGSQKQIQCSLVSSEAWFLVIFFTSHFGNLHLKCK